MTSMGLGNLNLEGGGGAGGPAVTRMTIDSGKFTAYFNNK